MLFSIVRRGKNPGIRLHPHLFEDDRYRVCLGRTGPYIPLADDRDIPEYLANGYSLHMSSKLQGCRPTLVRPESVRGWK